MEDKRFTDSFFFKLFCVSMFVAGVVFVLIYFKDLFKPLVAGIFFWYLIKAFNSQIEKIKIRGKKLNIWFRRGISLIVIAGIAQVSIDVFVSSVRSIIQNFDSYQASMNSAITIAGEHLGVDQFTPWIMEKIGGLDIEGALRGMLASASSMLGNVFLLVIYTIFILLEEGSFAKKFSLLLDGPNQEQRVAQLGERIFVSTNRYVAVKGFVSALTAIISGAILLFIGVDYTPLWILLIFILNFIPYIGSIIATLLPATFSVLQFGSPWPFVWVFGSVTAVQVVIGNYIEPRVMGKSLNLSPLVVLIALAFWGTVWDLLGMLLSVPITSILLITLAQFPRTHGFAIMLTENGDISDLQIKPQPE